MRKRDEGFDGNKESSPSSRWRATPHRGVASRWVRIPHNSKNSRYPDGYLLFLAEDEGFEPPQTESESGVLPLHKSSIVRHIAAWWRQQDSNLWPHACEASSGFYPDVILHLKLPKHLNTNDFSQWQPMRTAWWFQNWTTCLIPRALYIIKCSRNKAFYLN